MAATSQKRETFEDYAGFVDKFKPKLTTDDCYTPQNIYDTIADWVAEEYHVDQANFIRVFWPGGDYTHPGNYHPGDIVVDNPPFSILSEIIRFYTEHDIRFFLFCPALTALRPDVANVCVLAASVTITYENGAEVRTSFITNLDSYALRTVPELGRRVKAVNDANVKATKTQMPKYQYPDELVTAAFAGWLSNHGEDFNIRKEDCIFVRSLDSQLEAGKAIFGGGLLLTERAAAERAAAERAAATKWPLSDRERLLLAALSELQN